MAAAALSEPGAAAASAAEPLPLWLSENLVFEVGPTSTRMIVPRLRRRFELDAASLAFVAAISASNERGQPYSIDTNHPLLPVAEAFFELGIAQDTRPQQQPPARPSLLEIAAMRMSQVGRARPDTAGDWGRGRYLRSAETAISLGEPSPPGAELFEVLERRRSSRRPGPRSITLEGLGDLLACSYRMRSLAAEGKGEISFRPVASGGATHAIEIGLAVRSVDGLEDGLYRYDSIAHGLCRLPSGEGDETRLARSAALSMGSAEDPPLLLVFLADLDRVAAKYADSALALTYLDVGCLIQQLYIVAEGLTLPACAIGGGDAPLIERLFSPTPNHHFVAGFVIW
jgi:SagB-type dehydrogenase family enzyme